MSGKPSNRDETGASIVEVFDPTVAIETATIYPTLGSCRGFTSDEDGTIEAKLIRSSSSKMLKVSKGFNLYSIDLLGTGGSVALDKIQLFW